MLEKISIKDIASLIILMTTILTLFTVLIKGIDDRKKYRNKTYYYDRERNMMDDSRRYFETKIYQLENELMANQKRWESVNHLILSSQQNNNIDLNSNIENISLTSFFINFGITKDDIAIEKDLWREFSKVLSRIYVSAPINIGDIICKNIMNTGTDIICTKKIDNNR